MVNTYKRDIKVYVSWMLEAISKIKNYTENINTFEDLEADTKTLEACVFNIVQLWEIAMQIRDHYPDDKLSFEKEIVGMRNFLVHSYHKVETRIVFSVIKKNIPELEIILLNLK